MRKFTAKWKAALASEIAEGHDPTAAASEANRKHPGLRHAMLAEVNHGKSDRAAQFHREQAAAAGITFSD